MRGWLLLVLAFMVDFAIGDPTWLPHPVRIMGKGITWFERRLRRQSDTAAGQKRAGVLLVIMIVAPSLLLTFLLQKTIAHFSGGVAGIVGAVVLVYLAAATIAMRGLIDAARVVIRSVGEGDLGAARFHLSMIVGRDTAELSGKKVVTAAMETLAENLSDGVVAPVFYFALGGLPLAMAYKAINTLDSMVGYKNDRYINFGWAAARLDDVANYVPARLTGLLIVVSSFLAHLVRGSGSPVSAASRSYRIMRRDGRNHTSPNSGIPEAAMAGAVGVEMGGASTYGGMVVKKPFIGDAMTDDFMAASADVIRIVFIVSVLAVGIAAMLSSMRSGF